MSSPPSMAMAPKSSKRTVIRGKNPGASPGSQGMTLEAYAKDNGFTVDELRAENPTLKSLRPNQVIPPTILKSIRHPTPGSPGPSPRGRSHASPTALSRKTTEQLERKQSEALAKSPSGTPGSPVASGSPNLGSSGRAASTRREKVTIGSIATKHEFTTDEIRSANPAIAQLGDDDPLPAGTKVSLPKRTRPKLSTLVARLETTEHQARDTLVARYNIAIEELEDARSRTLETIHMLTDATRRRRNLLLAGVIDDAGLDYVGVDGGDTNDEDYLSADVDDLIKTMIQTAERADARHWARDVENTQLVVADAQPAVADRAGVHEDQPDSSPQQVESAGTVGSTTPLAGALPLTAGTELAASASIDGSPTDVRAIASFADVGTALNVRSDVPIAKRTCFDPKPVDSGQGFAQSPFAGLLPLIETEVRRAIALEREQFLRGNEDTLRALLTRRAKLRKFEAALNERFEELHLASERSRKREQTVEWAERRHKLVEQEHERRVEIVNAEVSARVEAAASLHSAMLRSLNEAHSYRWEHQLRMVAHSPGGSALPSPRGAGRGGHLDVPGRRVADGAASPGGESVQYIVIGGDTPSVRDLTSPDAETHLTIGPSEPVSPAPRAEEETAAARAPDPKSNSGTGADATPGALALVSSGEQTEGGEREFRLDAAAETSRDPVDPPTDSLATRQQHTGRPTPSNLAAATSPELNETDDVDAATLDADATGVSRSASRRSSHDSSGRATPQAAVPEQDADATDEDRDEGTRTRAEGADDRTARSAAQKREELDSGAAVVEPPKLAKRRRDPNSLFVEMPSSLAGAQAAATQHDDHDLRTGTTTATHVGLSATSRGRALLCVPLQRRHPLVLRFELDQRETAGGEPKDVRVPRPPPGLRKPAGRHVRKPRCALQLLAAQCADANSEGAHPLNFTDTESQFVTEGFTLRTAARVQFPDVAVESASRREAGAPSPSFVLKVDVEARVMELYDEDGDVVSRDGLWTVEGLQAPAEALCLAVNLVGTGTTLRVVS